MKKNIVFLFIFIQINLIFAQKDTLKFLVQKGTYPNIEKVETSPYRIFMSAGGIMGNPVMAYIDTSTIKTSKDSVKAEKFAKIYFAEAQKDYFNIIYKQIPDFHGLDFAGKTLISSDFYGKKSIIYFFSASVQASFDRLETVKRLHQKYASKGYQFLIVSPQSREELMQYGLLQDLPYPVLAQQDYIFSTYCKDLGKPFFIVADEKGIVQKVFVYSATNDGNAAPLDPEDDVPFDVTMPKKDLEAAFKQMSAKYIWLQVKDAVKMLNDKDYFWNQIDAYLSGK
jgi:peroxiredoxin